jgi:hypothetical protein
MEDIGSVTELAATVLGEEHGEQWRLASRSQRGSPPRPSLRSPLSTASLRRSYTVLARSGVVLNASPLLD